MTLVRLENGQPILEDGKIGVEDACCCGDECSPLTASFCCDGILPLWDGINYFLDPFGGNATECIDGTLYLFADSFVTDGTCFGGGACTFNARVYYTATFTLNGECYDISNVAFHDVVFTDVNCACEGALENFTTFNPC